MTRVRVEDLAGGRGYGWYIEEYGWWAQLVLDEFAFLLDLGYSLTSSAMAGVHFHQRGNYIWFEGNDRAVTTGYDPDDMYQIDADVVEHSDGRTGQPRWVPLDGLILQRLPDAAVPPRSTLDRPTIEANVRWWAAGLREIAAEVL